MYYCRSHRSYRLYGSHPATFLSYEIDHTDQESMYSLWYLDHEVKCESCIHLM